MQYLVAVYQGKVEKIEKSDFVKITANSRIKAALRLMSLQRVIPGYCTNVIGLVADVDGPQHDNELPFCVKRYDIQKDRASVEKRFAT